MVSPFFLFKINIPTTTATRSWGDLLKELLQNPVVFAQQNLIWIVVILLTLFVLSRVNNILEIRGVNRAIIISRGIISSITAFILAPAVCILLINLIAIVNGLPTINVSRIGDWIWLTATSYWWLGKCLFGGAPFMDMMYDGNSIIRMLWIGVPISFVWLRSATSNFTRLLLVPVLLGMLFVTRHREAPETFISEPLKPYFRDWFKDHTAFSPHDSTAIEKYTTYDNIDIDLDLVGDKDKIQKRTDNASKHISDFYQRNSSTIGLVVVGLILLALAVGYLMKKPGVGAILAICALLLFIMMNSDSMRWHPSGKTALERQAELDTLYNRFENKYIETDGKPSIDLSQLSTAINERVKFYNLSLPDSVCTRYKDYFRDYCRTSE